jgi:hypothetical protein
MFRTYKNADENFLCERYRSKLSFLYESAATTETIGRYSFVGAGTCAVISIVIL